MRVSTCSSVSPISLYFLIPPFIISSSQVITASLFPNTPQLSLTAALEPNVTYRSRPLYNLPLIALSFPLTQAINPFLSAGHNFKTTLSRRVSGEPLLITLLHVSIPGGKKRGKKKTLTLSITNVYI